MVEGKILISIITPVYNVEKYLPQCIDSVIAQTFRNWELILVDDGSTDRSGAICDEYAAKDSRIRVHHKENSGQADSRNIALRMARADLIGYVDSDDWIEPDMYEVLYRAMTETGADISVCGYFTSYTNCEKPSCRGGMTAVYDREEALKLILDDKVIKSYLVDKLYNRKVIVADQPGSYYYEDYATLFKWFDAADRVSVVETPMYHYRQRKGSTDHDGDPKKKYHFFLAEKERCSYLTRNGIFPELHPAFAAKVVRVGLREIKGIVRKCPPGDVSDHYIKCIKSELGAFMPVRIGSLGFFRWIALKLLFLCPDIYFFIMKISIRGKRKVRNAVNLYD